MRYRGQHQLHPEGSATSPNHTQHSLLYTHRSKPHLQHELHINGLSQR